MPVTAVNTDPENLTMTLVAEFEASVDRLWEVFTEPRQLERFWGPLDGRRPSPLSICSRAGGRSTG